MGQGTDAIDKCSRNGCLLVDTVQLTARGATNRNTKKGKDVREIGRQVQKGLAYVQSITRRDGYQKATCEPIRVITQMGRQNDAVQHTTV